MSTRPAIVDVVKGIRNFKGLEPMEISDSSRLGEDGLGLDSLDMAMMVAELEQKFDVDPFARGDARFETFGEVVSLYDREIAA